MWSDFTSGSGDGEDGQSISVGWYGCGLVVAVDSAENSGYWGLVPSELGTLSRMTADGDFLSSLGTPLCQ